MSILNACIRGDRAWVLVDTRAELGSTKIYCSSSKMIPIVHAGCVIAGRGHPSFLYAVYSVLASQPSIDSFDALEIGLEALLATTYKEWRKQILRSVRRISTEDRAALERQQILIAGWSHMRNEMLAVNRSQDALSKGFERLEVPAGNGYHAPWHQAWSEDPLPADLDVSDLIDFSNKQILRATHVTGSNAIGGSFVVSEISPGAIKISSFPAAEYSRKKLFSTQF